MMKNDSRVSIAFFSLLKSGLWEKEMLASYIFPLSDEEWLALYNESVRQTVQGIVFRGLSFLSTQLFPPESLFLRWLAQVAQIEENNVRSEHEIVELRQFFAAAGIKFVLKKGQSAATLYREPHLRVCGDIDLYFTTIADYRRAGHLIRRRGIDIYKRPDGSQEYVWNGIMVEHHSTLIDLKNPFLYIYLRRLELEKGFDTLTFADYEDASIAIPGRQLNLLMLNAHIMKHAFISGIGLRQLCDLARAYYSYGGQYDTAELRHIYRRAHILRWTGMLHNFLVVHLGLEERYLPYPRSIVSTEKLFCSVMTGGNFGQLMFGRGHYLSHKLFTLKAIYRNRSISLRYSAFEIFCWIVQLLYGQFREK